MPARMKQPLSRASGRSVEVRMQTAGNGHEHYVKPDPFNGSLEDIPIKFAVSFGYKIIDPDKKKK